MSSLGERHANAAIASAVKTAQRLDVNVSVAVADAGGHLVAFRRCDGASRISINMAIDKAFTAAMLELATADLAPLTQPAAPLFGLGTAERGRIVTFGGGIPIVITGQCWGGVGVGGGTVDQDAEIANAGAHAAETIE